MGKSASGSISGASGSNTAEKISKLVQNFNFISEEPVKSTPKEESPHRKPESTNAAATDHTLFKLKTDSLDAEHLLYGRGVVSCVAHSMLNEWAIQSMPF